eukprot:scaffold810_cov355-Pavlova_lutheri.AAC.36
MDLCITCTFFSPTPCLHHPSRAPWVPPCEYSHLLSSIRRGLATVFESSRWRWRRRRRCRTQDVARTPTRTVRAREELVDATGWRTAG